MAAQSPTSDTDPMSCPSILPKQAAEVGAFEKAGPPNPDSLPSGLITEDSGAGGEAGQEVDQEPGAKSIPLISST